MQKKHIVNWLILDIVIIFLFCASVLWGILGDGSSLLDSAFFFFVGGLILASNKMKSKSYISKALSWMAENIFKPKTKFNYIIWGLFFIFIGFLVLYSKPLSPSDKELFKTVERSFGFWIAVVLVIIFNILVGIYTAKRIKKKSSKDREGAVE